MDLDIVRIECEIVSEIPVRLISALYDSLRNFEMQYKLSCCLNASDQCVSCSENIRCPYRIVFDQGLSPDPVTVRLHQKPSLPFSLYVDATCGKSGCYKVGIVVIGAAVQYIELFHTALLRMVEECVSNDNVNSPFSLRTYSLDYQGEGHEITHAASFNDCVILLSGKYILESTVHSDCVRLSLKSPLRLLSNGLIAHQFDFATFFRSQMRRCSSLCAYYGVGELDLNYAQLSEHAQNVAVFDDRILYTQPPWSRRINRAGLTGTVECVGLVGPMHSLLLLGSYFNAGKGATFGSGFYQIEVI